MRITRSAFQIIFLIGVLLGVLLGAPIITRADSASPASPVELEPPLPWTLVLASNVSPLEGYPRFGLRAAIQHSFTTLRFGASVDAYLPREDGITTRTVLLWNAYAELTIAEGTSVSWHAGLGLGAGMFWDSYSAQTLDETRIRVGPGFELRTGLTLLVYEAVHPFVEVRGLKYFTSNIADDDWAELSLGVRLPL